jgi:peroxiredoxin/tetratricopeptide (TPR) repeat protein
MTRPQIALLLPLVLLCTSGLGAQVLPTDGQPRQPAQLVADCGQVSFPIRCQVENNQLFFNQGIAHLHAHSYLEAERAFRQVLATEPDIAMAYWGMAMANFADPDRAADLTEQALLLRTKSTERERQWLDALARYYEVTPNSAKKSHAIKKAQGAYAKLPTRKFLRPTMTKAAELVAGLRALTKSDPGDLEATMFLVDQLCRNRDLGIPVETREVQDLLMPLWKTNPQHHVRYHQMRLWLPVDPSRAIGSLAITPRPASGIPEQWHLEGRIQAARHDHAAAVRLFDTAVRGWHVRLARYRMMPYRDQGYAALLRDLAASLIQLGHPERVLELADTLRKFPRHPRYNQLGNPEHLAGLAPLLIIRFGGLHDDAGLLMKWEDAGWLKTGSHRRGAARVAAELGIAYARTGTHDRAAKWRERLRALRADAWPTEDARRIDDWIAQQEVWAALAAGLEADARRGLESCAMPELDRALCYHRLGDGEGAIEHIEAAVRSARHHVAARYWHVAILHAFGKMGRCRDAMKMLGMVSSGARPPLVDRLAPIAKEFRIDLETWWKVPDPRQASSTAVILDAIGPATWQPITARGWQLPGLKTKPVALADYQGRPIVVILYLGFGCLHCVEQLRDFHPHVAAYRKAGLQILAIGTETPKTMRKTYAELPIDERFAYTMLSDAKTRVFREWVAYEFFSHLPMHGTFLLDKAGKVLWQDISHEPFNHPKWFLAECKRLLRVRE